MAKLHIQLIIKVSIDNFVVLCKRKGTVIFLH